MARACEAAGIATVVLSSAFDISWRGWSPRTVFVDHPLGYTSGSPFESAAEREIALLSALQLLVEDVPAGDGLFSVLSRASWVEMEDWNESIGGGGTPKELTKWGPRTLDTRQPRDEIRRYQSVTDLIAEPPELGGAGAVVSREALRQAEVKRQRQLPSRVV